MKVIIGLGNSGNEYSNTRHNIGFMALNAYAAEKGLLFKNSSKFYCELTETTENDQKILLVKPTTMMNCSGDSVRLLRDFYKFEASDVLIISDDLDRDFGKIRVRQGGGHGGHNGLRSIINVIGEDFWRVRVGISNEMREKMDAADYVLSRFSKDEISEVQKLESTFNNKISSFIHEDLLSHSE